MNLIAHCETLPRLIDLDTAAARLRLLDPAQIPSDLTPESFMTTWNDIITSDLPIGNWTSPDAVSAAPAHRISVDNGATFCSPSEAVSALPWNTITNYMDADLMEQVSCELAPCTNEQFLTRYLELAEADLIIG